MISKYLILVKHSQPEIIEFLPAREWQLSEEGRKHAEELAEQLGQFQPELVISSDEPKAKQTAKIVAGKYQLEVCVVDGLHEHDRSNAPYVSQQSFRDSIREFFQKPDELVFGKETANQAYTRFYQAVHSILSEHRNQTVIVVTHGTVISLFVSRLTGNDGFELWEMLGLPSFIAIDLHSNTLIVKSSIA